MSNRETCISIINELEEESLSNVVVMLQSIKKFVDDTLDNAFCVRLYTDYLYDSDSEKHESMSLESFAEELGVELK